MRGRQHGYCGSGPVNGPIQAAMEQKIWCIIILAYCLIAAMVPMWLLLQPRGALGGYFLYIALFVAAIGVVFEGYEGSCCWYGIDQHDLCGYKERDRKLRDKA